MQRRDFLRQLGGQTPTPRPPWSRPNFTELCTGCGDCIRACPERVLYQANAGLPVIDFSLAGCSFCGRCAEVCPAGAFDRSQPAFHWRLQFATSCLALNQIDCRSCQELCDSQAIQFKPYKGKVAQPELNLAACTGCGSCLAVCPQHALSLVDVSTEAAIVAGFNRQEPKT